MNVPGIARPPRTHIESALGPRLSDHEQAVQDFEAADWAALTEKAAELAATRGLYVGTGRLGWKGASLFAYVLPIEENDRLVSQQAGPVPDKPSSLTRLKWGAASELRGYSEGHFSYYEAFLAAFANYQGGRSNPNDDPPLPE